jgi:hypothetical protein
MLAGQLGSAASSGDQVGDSLVADTVTQDVPAAVNLTPEPAPGPSETQHETAATFTSPTVDSFIGERPRDG